MLSAGAVAVEAGAERDAMANSWVSSCQRIAAMIVAVAKIPPSAYR
jgi:hypothetical protein